MVLKSYLIGPMEEGQQNNIEPFYLPEDAYFGLEDVYIWRGRIRKRFGYALIGDNDLESRLRINLGDTDGSGDISEPVPGSIFKIGQIFSIGSEIFTVNVLGTPATLLDTGSATVKTYNTNTGDLVIEGAAATTPCFFYPGEPVMGLRVRETSSINAEGLIAFDTQFAYERDMGAWVRLGTGAAAEWTGGNSDFFWSSNYRGIEASETFFFTVNNIPADNRKYLSYFKDASWNWFRYIS